MYQCQSGFLTGFSWAPPAWKLPCPCSGCVRVSWLPPASPAFQVPGVRISVGQEELASLFIYHLGSVFWSSVREILYFLFEQIISKYPCCNLASIWIFPALKTYCQKGWEKTLVPFSREFPTTVSVDFLCDRPRLQAGLDIPSLLYQIATLLGLSTCAGR